MGRNRYSRFGEPASAAVATSSGTGQGRPALSRTSSQTSWSGSGVCGTRRRQEAHPQRIRPRAAGGARRPPGPRARAACAGWRCGPPLPTRPPYARQPASPGGQACVRGRAGRPRRTEAQRADVGGVQLCPVGAARRGRLAAPVHVRVLLKALLHTRLVACARAAAARSAAGMQRTALHAATALAPHG